MSKEHRLQVMELFGPTIQGEGIMTGTVTHFLRTGGCPLRCEWCDSLFAVLPEEIKKHRRLMTTAEIYYELTALPKAPYVTFTGGDPCIQERLGDIIPMLNVQADMRVAVETQGQYFPEWLEAADVITFSPKGPSSGNIVDVEDLYNWLVKHQRRPFSVCIKIVVFNAADYEYALHVYNRMPYALYDTFYFTAGTPMHLSDLERTMGVLALEQQLAMFMLENKAGTTFNDKVHLGCQQHVLLWPDKTKGV